jgi:hypothetical protein
MCRLIVTWLGLIREVAHSDGLKAAAQTAAYMLGILVLATLAIILDPLTGGRRR